jgi:hypothetical protein
MGKPIRVTSFYQESHLLNECGTRVEQGANMNAGSVLQKN